MTKFVPDEWELTDKLRDYAKSKGLSDKQIAEQEERFRLCQFPRPILDFNRAWQRWILNAIDWGKVVPATTREYRTPEQVTEEQRRIDAEKAKEQFRKYGIKGI